MLMDEAALKERCSKARYDILRRAKPRLWKSGKRKGIVRTPGITELTFTSADLWQRALNQVGPGAIPCPYCLEIGRPAFIITLANYVWDHKIPVTHGGQPVLDNLFAICEDCNKLKGSMSYPFFIALMSAIEKWEDPKDRSYLHACLRTHGKAIKGFRGKWKEAPAPEVVITGNLPLAEDF
jgi:5-methylcytosine-specific restriction endonuclease McrA